VRGLFPAGYCQTPTSELAKTERGPISTIVLSLFSMSPNRAIFSDKLNFFSPLAAARPLTILSGQEALKASIARWSKRCRCWGLPGRRHATMLDVLANPETPTLQ